MSYRVCVALQVKSDNLEENQVLIKRSLELKPDLIELRWDYIKNKDSIKPDLIKALIDAIKPEIPVICTFRSSSEGGLMQTSDEVRKIIIQTLISEKPNFLDIEMRNPDPFLKEIIDLAVKNGVKLIFSYHDFQKTPSFEEGKDIMMSFFRKLGMLCTHKTDKTGPFIYKLIFSATAFEDNFIPIKLCKFYSKLGEDRNIISFCMGDLGIFSRIFCVKYGSYLTFASIEEATAPGQIRLDKLREAHQILI